MTSGHYCRDAVRLGIVESVFVWLDEPPAEFMSGTQSFSPQAGEYKDSYGNCTMAPDEDDDEWWKKG